MYALKNTIQSKIQRRVQIIEKTTIFSAENDTTYTVHKFSLITTILIWTIICLHKWSHKHFYKGKMESCHQSSLKKLGEYLNDMGHM